MILMGMTEPDHLDPLSLTQSNKPFSIRSGIDENTRTFDIQGMTRRVLPSVIPWNEPNRTKMLLFQDSYLQADLRLDDGFIRNPFSKELHIPFHRRHIDWQYPGSHDPLSFRESRSPPNGFPSLPQDGPARYHFH